MGWLDGSPPIDVGHIAEAIGNVFSGGGGKSKKKAGPGPAPAPAPPPAWNQADALKKNTGRNYLKGVTGPGQDFTPSGNVPNSTYSGNDKAADPMATAAGVAKLLGPYMQTNNQDLMSSLTKLGDQGEAFTNANLKNLPEQYKGIAKSNADRSKLGLAQLRQGLSKKFETQPAYEALMNMVQQHRSLQEQMYNQQIQSALQIQALQAQLGAGTGAATSSAVAGATQPMQPPGQASALPSGIKFSG